MARTRRGAAAVPAVPIEPTHPGRLLFPEAGLTKGDVFAYYDAVADALIPFLRDRPITLERLPDGLTRPDAPHFWQKNTPAFYPEWIPRAALPTETRKIVRYALVNDRAALLYLVNQGAMTFHVWASRVGRLDQPDFVLFDLDPGGASFAMVVEVARRLRAALAEEGLTAYPKTSGKTGLHVLVPWDAARGNFDAARAWARERAERLARRFPQLATVELRKAKRGDRVYVDVLQNARGHHAVPPYVVRAIPRATVSTPLRWAEVRPGLDPARFTTGRMIRRLRHQRHGPLDALLEIGRR